MRRLTVFAIPFLAAAVLAGCSSAPDTASTAPDTASTESAALDTTEVSEEVVSQPEEVVEPDDGAAEAVVPEPPSQPVEVAAPPAAAPPPVALRNDEDRTIYALGLVLSRNIAEFELSANEVEIVKRALSDAASGEPAVDLDTWGPKISGLAAARVAVASERREAVGAAFLSQAAGRAGAERTDSGIVYRELAAGSGASPTASDTVRVNYRGTLIDGTEFDSSYARDEPAEFGLGQVIPCWTEGVQKLQVGGKAELVCPSDLAYGPNSQPNIPANSTLIFEVELLAIVGE
jgi:FKBP-type peptidyl-prolyl cis-trans isomerase FkpA